MNAKERYNLDIKNIFNTLENTKKLYGTEYSVIHNEETKMTEVRGKDHMILSFHIDGPSPDSTYLFHKLEVTSADIWITDPESTETQPKLMVVWSLVN